MCRFLPFWVLFLAGGLACATTSVRAGGGVPPPVSQQHVSQQQGATEEGEAFLIEALPRDAALEVAKQRADMEKRRLYGMQATRGVYSSLFVWPQTLPRINVCFLDGSLDLRRYVAEVAIEWRTLTGAPLDFGDPASPRTCDPEATDQHIRVSFAAHGEVWSALGRQSMMMPKSFPLWGASMNLGFDLSFPKSKRRRAVLHEFGHALGLEHEHQSPKGACMGEYDTDKLFEFLRDNKGWDRARMELQLGLLDKKGIIATEFDKDSIMIYGFPARFYRDRERSHCFAEEHEGLSPADVRLVSSLYPAEAGAKIAVLEKRSDFVRTNAFAPSLTRSVESPEKHSVSEQVDALILDLAVELKPQPKN